MSSRQKQTLFYILFSLIYFSLATPSVLAGIDLDASWHEALVMGVEKKLTFGKDFIFNYGPLGYLNTGVLPKGVSVGWMVLFEVFLLANYLFIIHLCFQRPKGKEWIVMLASVIILIPWGFFSDTTFTLFYLLLFWLLYAHQTQKMFGLLLAMLLTILIFYIKVNLSIIAYAVLYGSLLYFAVIKKFNFGVVITLILLQIFFTFGLSFLLNVDIPAYLLASVKIIDAYQDAMAEMILSKREFLILLGFEMLILAMAIGLIIRSLLSEPHPPATSPVERGGKFLSILGEGFRVRFSSLYLYLLVALAWFLCFKQAHTAVGHYNVFGFFLLMPMLSVLLYLFIAENRKADAGKVVLLIIIIQLIATQFIRVSMGNYTLKGYLLTYPPHAIAGRLEKGEKMNVMAEIIKEKNPFNYLNKILNYNPENHFKNPVINAEKHLPANILSKIGNATVDVVPTDISLIFFNRLNYNPRPVIQSYQANSDWLMQRNGEKYSSATAPEYVLYRIDMFRGQYPFWIETNLNEALLRNYQLEDTLLVKKDTLFLFHRNHNSNLSEPTKNTTQKITFQLNQEIDVPPIANYAKFYADFKYNLVGKLARLFFQPPYLYCTVTYQDGGQYTYRVIDKIMRGGIIVNPKVTTQAEAAHFFLGKMGENKQVKKLKFWSKYERGFQPQFEGYFELK